MSSLQQLRTRVHQWINPDNLYFAVSPLVRVNSNQAMYDGSGQPVPPVDMFINMKPTLHLANKMRKALGEPLIITSAYRPIAYNSAIKYADETIEGSNQRKYDSQQDLPKHNSAHQDFNALDIQAAGSASISKNEFVRWAHAYLKQFPKKDPPVPTVQGKRATYTATNETDQDGYPAPSTNHLKTEPFGRELRYGVYGPEHGSFVHIDTARTIYQRGHHWTLIDRNNFLRPPSIEVPLPSETFASGERATASRFSTPQDTASQKETERAERDLTRTNQQNDGQDVIFNDGTIEDGTPFTLNHYLTPEELRKGIIAQEFTFNDWHLNTLASEEDQSGDRKNVNVSRGDLSLNERQRYAASLVEAEYYRRRFSSRSMSGLQGPFNPYVVPGFPAVVLHPPRPVIAMLESVSHHINVPGGTAQTSMTFSSPRYWDEGDIFHWMGGWSEKDMGYLDKPGYDPAPSPNTTKDEADVLYRRFPQWHNRHTIAENSYPSMEDAKNDQNRRETRLDAFYQYTLGTESIEYMSNHWDDVDNPDLIERAIKDRDPGPFEVSPETLDIQDYNQMIAGTVEKNGTLHYAPWSLMGRFWGERPVKETDDTSTKDPEKARDYAERYGIRERALMVDYLDNAARQTSSGHMVYVGPTFANEGTEERTASLNPQQQRILSYIDNIETFDVGGGTRD